jgi:hypothetical protein
MKLNPSRSISAARLSRMACHGLPVAKFGATLLVPLGVCLWGCSGEPLNLGSNGAALEGDAACGGGVFVGDVVAHDQAGLDALLGCREIVGDLIIELTPEDPPVSLAPLASLEVVKGRVRLDALPSLIGLEALREVYGLRLVNLTAPDLLPLSNLERVNIDPAGDPLVGGSLNISNCDALADLHGLEKLTTWTELAVVSNDALQSLDGLSAPTKVGTIQLALLPALRSASALAPVLEAGAVSLFATGVENLDGFQLQNADSLFFKGNPNLTDLGGLARLERLQSMVLDDNDSLERVELPGLIEVHVVSITGNAVLETIPPYAASNGPGFIVADESGDSIESLIFTQFLYDIGNNARLTSVTLPDGYRQVQQVAIHGNPNLSVLDLNALARPDGLLIQDNPLLSRIELPRLERIGTLELTNNAALSVAPFDAIPTFTRNISGNLDQ